MVIKIWNLSKGQLRLNLTGHTYWINALEVLADSELASGSVDQNINIWNTKSGLLRTCLKGHTNSVLALQSLGGNELASGSGDCNIKVISK